ncbi:MAG TPA: MFS transporter [Pirellulales bacterium]
MTQPAPSAHSLRALDALNFFLADVRDGMGPYLAVYLSMLAWEPGRIGIAMSLMGIATVAAQTPAGALIDATRHKRAAIIIASLAVAVGALTMVRWPTLPAIVAAQMLMGSAAAVFPPAIAAVTLGLVGHAHFARRTGRNEAFNHAGNVAAALAALAVGMAVAYTGIFYLLAVMCLAASATTAFIRGGEIDDERARGAAQARESGTESAPRNGAGSPPAASVAVLLTDRRILAFAAAVVLFHFANAAMLPLVGQKLTQGNAHGAAAYMSACIIAAQLVMVPVAVLASRLAESWGRKPTLLIAFAVLPLRGVLYTCTANPYALVAIQLLDGIGAGIIGVVGVLAIADLTQGTGRFNLMQGALATATGIGASLSNLLTGYVVEATSQDFGFATLAGIAGFALGFLWLLVGETRPVEPSEARLESRLPADVIATSV